MIGFGLFDGATAINTVMVLRHAIKRFGRPATILSDNDSHFVGVQRSNPSKGWLPTEFEAELQRQDIGLINSRPYHPQTNGKLERFFRTLETELDSFDRLDDFTGYYNERRLHGSLDIDNFEKPLGHFATKKPQK